ncbi:MAG: hypothetical protein IT210_12345 [Armatimonadetes bacterium]|nr:hypothetical protein [Armatimonadota bacterium]
MAFLSEKNNTGPFRRVLSKTGFAYESADIYLPGRQNITTLTPDGDQKPSGDTVYVYMGGRGGNGGEVDAGFQYSSTYDNWSLFLAVSGFGFTYGPQPGASAYERFASERTVKLEFEVIDRDLLEVKATGAIASTGDLVAYEIRVDVSKYPTSNSNVEADSAGKPTKFHWNPEGGGNRLKRVTSIGQHQGVQDFHTGSFVQEVRWENCMIGASKAAAMPWTASNTGSFVSYPNSDIVVVEFFSQSSEIVSIDL